MVQHIMVSVNTRVNSTPLWSHAATVLLQKDCLCCRYTAADLDSRESLSPQDQQLVNGLAQAEQQGLLDVYLVMIRHTQHPSVANKKCPNDANEMDRMLGYKQFVTNIACWRTLNGKDPCLEGTMDLCHDIILQATPAHYAQPTGTAAAMSVVQSTLPALLL